MKVSLKAMRVHRDMTQDQVARALNVHKKTVISWECGKTMPNTGMIEPICSLFSCSYDDIEWNHNFLCSTKTL